MKGIGIIIILIGYLACHSKSENATEVSDHEKLVKNDSSSFKTIETETSTVNQYVWKENYDYADALINRINPPSGFNRVLAPKGSFGDWLRHLPLKPNNAKVYYHNGKEKWTQNVHAAVVDIDVGKRDLQQCADAVMRLKAEYHYSLRQFDRIHFNFTSGDKVAFEDWRKGRKPIISGSRVGFSNPSGSPNNSYPNFKKYMIQIFSYAGTASLEKELNPVELENIKIGDVFIQGGFPGHAIIVVDLVENEAGEKMFLLAQSYMPAQDIHILKNLDEQGLSPWYSLNFGEELRTPEWSFWRDDLRRF